MAKIKIGYVGYTSGTPYWEDTVDDYTTDSKKPMWAANIFRSKKEAKKRFEDVREVFVEWKSK